MTASSEMRWLPSTRTRTIFGGVWARTALSVLTARPAASKAHLAARRTVRRPGRLSRGKGVPSGREIELRGFPEGEPIPLQEHLHVTAAGKLPLDEILREGVFDVTLDGPPQRPGPIRPLRRGRLQQPLVGFVRQGDLETP